jgi:mannan endo-1,4-beta-mannosidase
MKRFTSLAVAASLFTSTAFAAPSWGKKASSVPSVDGKVFDIDGKPQYFAGTNSWWLGHLTSDADVEQACSEISSSGLKVSRVWAFGNANKPSDQSIYYQLLDNVTQTISINYNATSGIPRLDSAIKHAEKYNLKLVLPMLNNWDDLGGIDTYCKDPQRHTSHPSFSAFQPYFR